MTVATTVIPANALARGPATTLPAPSGFRLQGSNGFTVAVFAYRAGWGLPSQVALVASRKGADAHYAAPATVTPTSFEADFGALGKVAVSYRPTGGAEEFGGRCGSGRFFESGFYEGTIEFHGEGGYTGVSSNWARGRLDPPCGSRSETQGTGITGGELIASRFSFASGSGVMFEAVKNHPTASAAFRATVLEASGDVAIVRSVRARAPSSAFRYGASLRRAAVEPPRPFSGRGSFHRESRGRAHWKGSLTVDFPGKPGVRLTGRGFRANLRHAEVKETRH